MLRLEEYGAFRQCIDFTAKTQFAKIVQHLTAESSAAGQPVDTRGELQALKKFKQR
jgi:hypothetical protein